MEKISFDSGIKTYKLNGTGELRFNPCDPNVYARFRQAVADLEGLVSQMTGEDAFFRADKRLKEILAEVFGQHNDFDAILGGVNLLATAGNGRAVIFNLLEALAPVLEQGAQDFVRSVIGHD